MKVKIYIAGLMLMLGCASCTHSHVEFSYFNLSQHEIWVTDVVGVPEDAPPGRLEPVPDEDRLSENSFHAFNTVKIAEKVRIIWQEDAQKDRANSEPAHKGAMHEVELSRDQLGVPQKIQNGEIRLTYLGRGRWFGAYFED